MSDSQPAALMRSEILEQPTVLDRLLTNADSTLKLVAERARQCSFAVLAARGSSDNASTYGKYLLEGLAGLPTALASPSLFTLYHTPPRLKDALVVGVSQSGQAADVVEVLQQARRQGGITLAVTNTEGSPLTEAADYVVLLNAGLERALAATKTVTAQCAVYSLLASHLSATSELRRNLPHLGDSVQQVIEQDNRIAVLAQEWVPAGRSVVIGRGYAFAAAQETALKLKETCYMSAESYSAADFMHGPLAMIEQDYPTLMLLNADATLPACLAMAEQVRGRGARMVYFTATGVEVLPDDGGSILSISSPSPLLSPIPFIVAGQLFALHLSLARGNNPDMSRGLKKVTVTR